jgi:hypothetical protein
MERMEEDMEGKLTSRSCCISCYREKSFLMNKPMLALLLIVSPVGVWGEQEYGDQVIVNRDVGEIDAVWALGLGQRLERSVTAQ